MASNFKRITIDFETFSEADIKKTGAWVYSRHPSTEVMCLSVRFPNGHRELWYPNSDIGDTHHLMALLSASGSMPIEAHNAFFELCIWENVLVPKYGFPIVDRKRWVCSAAKAAALALPRDLEKLAIALHLPVEKDMEGRRLMLKMSKPRKPTKKDPRTRNEDPTDLIRLYQYCETDTETEELASEKMPDLIPQESELFYFDQKINIKGVHIDRPKINTALRFIEQYSKSLLEELREITNGEIQTAGQLDKIKSWLKVRGLDLEGLSAGIVESALEEEDLLPECRRILEIRQKLSMSSTKKFQRFLDMADTDDRIRGTMLYHGATTGRWAGRGIQPHNFPRGKIKDVKDCIKLLGLDDYDLFEMFYGDVLGALSSCLRGMISAPIGMDFMAADFAAIESRVLFWLAGELIGLKAYTTHGKVYEDMAAFIYQVPLSTIKNPSDERHLGKAAILGCIAEGSLIRIKEKRLHRNIKIEDLQLNHLIWDGYKWVSHEGVLDKGKKKVMSIPNSNLKATWDHWLIENSIWKTTTEIVLGNTLVLNRETETELLKYCRKNINTDLNAVSLFAVFAELRNQLELISTTTEKIFYVVPALKSITQAEDLNQMALEILSHVLNSGQCGGIGLTVSKDVAITQQIKITKITEGGGSSVNLSPLENFLRTLLLLIIGKSGGSLLIVSTPTKDTKKEILELLVKLKTIETKETTTYDINNCGKNNRFWVEGFIAHNCGFQCGKKKFYDMCVEQKVPGITRPLAAKAVQGFRDKYKKVVSYWYAINNAAIKAVKTGQQTEVGLIKFKLIGSYLYVRLPSGRKLSYYEPKVILTETDFGMKDQLSFMGMNSKTRKWERQRTYGGKLVENIVQAVARDFMAEAMVRVDNKGYEIILTVHDEIITEIPEDFGDIKEFCELMSVIPKWGAGCPIKAEGWRGKRFKK